MRKYLWLAVAVVIFIAVACIFPHAVGFVMGIYPTPAGTPFTYQLWSGVVPAVAIVGVIWPFVNCHVEGCPRYGRYRVEGFKVCHIHHPSDAVGKKGITAENVRKLHRYSRNNR